jgi:acetyltransferase-like isoleucine patch superfamily enzyme
VSDAPRIHPTALVEDGVVIGPGTAVWDNVHVRGPATIGRHCILGEKTYVAYGVRIGDYVKVNAQVYVCTGVTLEDRVFVAAGVVFTNDRFPRAFADGHDGLAPSEPNEDTLETVVRTGATLGARAVIGPGLEIGAYAMVGMGAVVVADVPPHALVVGSPARVRGWVCVCGTPVVRGEARPAADGVPPCGRCGRRWRLGGGDAAPRLLPEVA